MQIETPTGVAPREPTSATRTVVEWIVLAAVIASAGLFQVTTDVNQWLLTNADMLLLPELYEDLNSGGSLSDWYLPYSPYFFPDWLFYWIAEPLGSTEATRLAIVAVAQFGVAVLAVASIAKTVTGRPQRLATAAAASVIVLGGLGSIRPFTYLATPFVHFGTFAFTLWLIAFALRYTRDERANRWLVLSLGLSVLLVGSDRIIAVWFHVPAALAMVAWGWQAHRRRAVVWIGAHVVATTAVLPLRDLVRTKESTYDLALSATSPRAGLKGLYEALSDAIGDGWWIQVLVVVSFVVVVASFARGRSVLGGRRLQPDASRFLVVFVPATAIVTFAAQIMLSGAVEPGPRYSMTVFFLPIFLLAAVVVPPAMDRRTTAALAVPVIVLAAVLAPTLPDIDLGREPAGMECLHDALAITGSTHGVASYWDARDLSVYLDDPDVVMATYSPLNRGERINVSEESYAERYDFIAVSSIVPWWVLDLDRIEFLNGPPRQIVECGRFTVWDYGPDGLDMEPFDTPNTVTWTACQLSTQVGTLDEASCTISGGEAPGFLAFGPYPTVPNGSYRARLQYRAPGTGPVAGWELAFTGELGAAPEIAQTGTVDGTDDRDGELIIDWETTDAPLGREPVVEVRIVADGTPGVAITAIEITRLD